VLKRDLNKAFGVVLRDYRKAAKMSQEKLSEKADVDVKMIGRIETFIRNPSLNLADSLAHALGVPLSQMIKEAEGVRQRVQTSKKRPGT
jgi:transcriptional regulator with XRE-family HTH domain